MFKVHLLVWPHYKNNCKELQLLNLRCALSKITTLLREKKKLPILRTKNSTRNMLELIKSEPISTVDTLTSNFQLKSRLRILIRSDNRSSKSPPQMSISSDRPLETPKPHFLKSKKVILQHPPENSCMVDHLVQKNLIQIFGPIELLTSIRKLGIKIVVKVLLLR